jgi:hypothetical protein
MAVKREGFCGRVDSFQEDVRVYNYGDDESLRGGGAVQFRLLYSGELLSVQSGKTHAAHKHRVRRAIHPQLRRLWEARKPLRGYAGLKAPWWINEHPEAQVTAPEGSPFSDEGWDTEEMRQLGIKYLAEKWARCGRGFIPLVTEEMCLRCSLDILFLRTDVAGRVLQSRARSGLPGSIPGWGKAPSGIDRIIILDSQESNAMKG